ncbi:MAG: chemotaxis protein CheR [endosymbiont of Seepiophila jonesi]|uniref:Chemotaxis protein methyltransferase n=1 Tax=endosymbiont of Lamellibrachia luymesi TaxID=2200907 RepID=A0A370DZQ2_9GAMM|nr:MAG: chemotaxis protein CheR [endosymbiont of Seepiophila jonesi]RDH92404.1 MAG: chemotaxis protein CheR [endosymbiont of Lamellibrachia luymesi]
MRDREFEFTRADFEFLRGIANQRTGIVVSDDKFDMFYSRLSRRVRKLGMATFSEYCDLIRANQDGDEMVELVNSITTNLTAFFRENHHFEYLAKTVIPELLAKNSAERNIRIWSAGCSTGEEPYSLSITLNEVLAQAAGWDVKVLATDIDSNVLARAASGVYPMERVNGLDKARLRRWFQKGKGELGGKARLKPEVRRLVEFGQLNLMQQWSIDSPKDVIFCRNVIIYFDKESKIKLIDRYADNLKVGGYLFIGHPESLFKLTDRFELIGQTIYRKVK